MTSDVIVLGGGPGGYIAAERLARAGQSVVLIEQDTVGGTCLNVGCIPTKALLHSAKVLHTARQAGQFGVVVDQASPDWAAMQAWKATTVTRLVTGVTSMLRRAGVQVVSGRGQLVARDTVQVGQQTWQARDVIIATGSAPLMADIPGAADNPLVVDSTALLGVDQPPERLAIIGAGVIGLEFAALFSRLGSQVTVVEMLDEVVPVMEPELAAKLRAGLPEVTFHLGCQVSSIDQARLICRQGEAELVIEADLVLMAVGRRPAVEGWGADQIGLEHSAQGVVVDDRMRTNLPHVWAVGDVTGRVLLAHAAYRMGEVAAADILEPGARGQRLRPDAIPWAVYTDPEAAGVGLTVAECARRGLAVEQVSVPLVTSGRYVAERGLDSTGAVTMVAERASGVIRGIQVLGPYASEMIWGAAGLIEMEFSVQDVRQLVFPHPSVSEGIREAAWAFPDQEKRP
jgi:dihydrolipoamide dehydrogenase